MASAQAASSNDVRHWASSPRPKGRENAKNTLCRNVVIYGYCRNEKDGCPFNHDTNRSTSSVPSTQAQNENSVKRRFNVDSPSFTPVQPEPNGLSVPTFSPKAAIAAPFTPKSSRTNLNGGLGLTHHQSSEWSNHEIREFVPQAFNAPPSLNDHNAPPSLGDPFNPYNEASNYSLESTPPTQINPYATDIMQTATAPFYQPQTTYTQPLQYHLYAPLPPYKENLQPYQRTAHDFFISENLRQELQRKADATLQMLPSTHLPTNIEHFHSLVPLDLANQKSAVSFGYSSWLYKAISSKDGMTYALRRIEGYRLTNEKAVRPIQTWKRLTNGNIVVIHDCFTTRAFGDSSLVFVTDFHPLSRTLADQYIPQNLSFNTKRPSSSPLQEQLLWTYIVQIASALKSIHSQSLAARVINLSKVVITNKNRIRLNGCGVLDVVQFNDQQSIQQLQQEDMQQLGRLIISLATGQSSITSTSKSLEVVQRTYGSRITNILGSLVENPPSIEEFISSIADQFAVQLDNSFNAEDGLYAELNRELENARLVRLLSKLGCVNERPEYSSNEQHHGGSHSSVNQWSETGERYFLKLFRDFVFHQVNQDGRPVVDLGHIITCLNKLDAGSEEKIALVSRDDQNVFVVSYKELKRALESAFQELLKNHRRV